MPLTTAPPASCSFLSLCIVAFKWLSSLSSFISFPSSYNCCSPNSTPTSYTVCPGFKFRPLKYCGFRQTVPDKYHESISDCPPTSFTARSLTLHYSLPPSARSLTVLSVSFLLLILDLLGRHRSCKVQQTMKPTPLRWTSISRRCKAS